MELKDNLHNQIESLAEKGNESMDNERYDKVCNAVFGWGKEAYQIDAESQDLSLI